MHWTVTYDDGHEATEAEYGSVRHLPDAERVVVIRVGDVSVPVPGTAVPLWLRRVAINANTGEQTAHTMIGWADGDVRCEVWVGPDGTVREEAP